MELQLKIVGFLFIALSFTHVIFPKYFYWKNDLKQINLINRQVMYVHTFFIALLVLLMGLLCTTSAQELIETKLGNKISLGLGIFWGIRLIVQFFGYSSTHWKGKRFETIVHVLLILLWAYLAMVFFYTYWQYKS
jgi:hypothetical protein